MPKKSKLKSAKSSARNAASRSASAPDQSPATKNKPRGKGAWKMMDRAATVAGTVLSAQATGLAWRVLSGRKAPKSGRHPDISNKEAALYAIIAGALSELVKTSVRRGTATYWVRSTGSLPPGMKPLSDTAAGEETELEAAAKPPAKARRFRRSSGGAGR